MRNVPTAMHEFADEQSTAWRLLSKAPSTLGVGGTVHAADATEGASASVAVASQTRRNGRSDISRRHYASDRAASIGCELLAGELEPPDAA